MRKKIVIGCLFAVSLLVVMPNISAVNDNLCAESFKSENLEKIDNAEEKHLLDTSIWDLLRIYIQMMYHFRMTRVNLWYLFATLPGLTGTLLDLVELRAYLLSTRANVSRDVLIAILDVLEDLIPLKN
jgi:hypothetical protein